MLYFKEWNSYLDYLNYYGNIRKLGRVKEYLLSFVLQGSLEKDFIVYQKLKCFETFFLYQRVLLKAFFSENESYNFSSVSYFHILDTQCIF